MASYECVNNDYTLIGPSTRRCLRDGNWNGTDPSCISKPININPFEAVTAIWWARNQSHFLILKSAYADLASLFLE